MFKIVKYSRISEGVAEQIKEAILQGKLKPGDRLPPERELMKEFQVSKVSLREALRHLEILGFLQVKQGVGGGAYINEIDFKPAKNFLLDLFHFKNLSVKNLSQVRFIIEPPTVEIATSRINRKELEELELNIQENEKEIASHIVETEKGIEFHRLIGIFSGNPILALTIDYVLDLYAKARKILAPDLSFNQKVVYDHKKIYQALVKKDPKKAREEMLKHLEEVESHTLLLERGLKEKYKTEMF